MPQLLSTRGAKLTGAALLAGVLGLAAANPAQASALLASLQSPDAFIPGKSGNLFACHCGVLALYCPCIQSHALQAAYG